jgi:hypothetical protein
MAEDPEVQLLPLRSSLAAELAGSARPRRRVCRGGGAAAPALEGPLPGLGPQRLESLRSLSEPSPRHLVLCEALGAVTVLRRRVNLLLAAHQTRQ